MALEKLALEALQGSGGSDELEPVVRKVISEYMRRASEQEEPALKASCRRSASAGRSSKAC